MERPWQRTLVGVFDIVSGIFAFSLAAFVLATLSSVKTPFPAFQISLSIVLAFFVILGILAVAGAICALRQKIWALALAGSLSASICLPLLGIQASIITLLSKEVPKAIRVVILIFFSPLWLLYLGLITFILMGYGL